jgi:hypothetical protein
MKKEIPTNTENASKFESEIVNRIKQLEEQSIEEKKIFKNTGFGLAFENLMNKYPELFDGKCKVMKNGQYHIDLESKYWSIKSNSSPLSSSFEKRTGFTTGSRHH